MTCIIDLSSVVIVEKNKCCGCGNCVEICSAEATQAISLEAGVAHISKTLCYLYKNLECKAPCVNACACQAISRLED
ncbi:MAG: ferredoxin [Candidatus Hodarchaeales archaeon]|jgi:Fe-S-cluster-containing hydrogenase component 2